MMFQRDRLTITGTLCSFSHSAQSMAAMHAQIAKESWQKRQKDRQTKKRYKEAYKELMDDIEEKGESVLARQGDRVVEYSTIYSRDEATHPRISPRL